MASQPSVQTRRGLCDGGRVSANGGSVNRAYSANPVAWAFAEIQEARNLGTRWVPDPSGVRLVSPEYVDALRERVVRRWGMTYDEAVKARDSR